jgi:preprotein translocase subunit SecE
VARNRKRAKDRRPRRPQDESGVATAGLGADSGSPEPLAHATPDAELAEAQLALGRPDLASGGDGGSGRGGDRSGIGDDDGGSDFGDDAAQLVPADETAVAVKVNPIARMTNFLRGSWRELQRVQWPDRRQVMQATGVVLGFVIVAGVYLGVADFVAQKLVNFILK